MAVHNQYKSYDGIVSKYELVKGWLHNNIFLVREDTVSKGQQLWSAFDANTGKAIRRSRDANRNDCLFRAELQTMLV